jgi:chromosomal replication initiator protein
MNRVLHIKKKISLITGVSVEELSEPSRKDMVIYSRHLAMYFCRKYTNESEVKIAKEFGRTDHTTTRNAIKKINNRIDSQKNFIDTILFIDAQIKLEKLD